MIGLLGLDQALPTTIWKMLTKYFKRNYLISGTARARDSESLVSGEIEDRDPKEIVAGLRASKMKLDFLFLTGSDTLRVGTNTETSDGNEKD